MEDFSSAELKAYVKDEDGAVLNQQLIKNNKLVKAQNLILIAKCFTRQCFPI